jgi:hypothetical protein
MISSLKQKQQQKKLRQELRTRIRENSRIDGERLLFDGQSIDRGYLDGEQHSRRGCYQPEEERVTQKRSETDRKSSKRQFVYPKARIVLMVFVVVALLLLLSPLFSSEPGLLQVGTKGMLDAFSISKEEHVSNNSLEVDSDVSWQGGYSNELPEAFDEEIGLQGDSPLAVSSNGRTIGFTRVGTSAEVMSSIQSDLESKGWVYVASGQDSAATFVKDEGKFRWLAVTCVTVGDEVSVVLVPAENKDTENKNTN